MKVKPIFRSKPRNQKKMLVVFMFLICLLSLHLLIDRYDLIECTLQELLEKLD